MNNQVNPRGLGGAFGGESYASGIVASSNRTQQGATPLNAHVNRVDVSTAPNASTGRDDL